MKDYTEFMEDARQWQLNRPKFTLDQLIPNDIGLGVIAGRWWLGKTNLSLEMAICLATGDNFFGFSVDPVPVVFLDFEGSLTNISDRITKISKRHALPTYGSFNVSPLRDKRFILHNNIDRLVQEVGYAKVAFIDGGKHLIGGKYISPDRIKEFAEDLNDAMKKSGFFTVITWQIRKPNKITRIEPGDLDEIKGGADIVEDSTFTILLEKQKPWRLPDKSWFKVPDNWINMYIGKAKETDLDFPNPYRCFDFNKEKCEFKVR